MAAFLNDRVLDFGVNELTSNANRVDLCSQAPTTYAEATSTYTMGNKTAISFGSPADATSGRKVVLTAVTGGSLTATGNVTHYAITDTSNSRLLVVQAVASSPVAVTSGDTWAFTGDVEVNIPDPTS